MVQPLVVRVLEVTEYPPTGHGYDRRIHAMLRKLAEKTYPDAKGIHVVLDNFSIHDSKITRAAVAELGGRVKLHFPPPYCPQANRIERVWRDLHANVTPNHRCADMDELMGNVSRYFATRNARTRADLRQAA